MTERISNDEIMSIFAFGRHSTVPDGWTRLGEGCSRVAFLAPDGWVYKVGGSYQCRSEVESSQRFYLDSDSTVIFPYAEKVGQVDDHTWVVRMEYIQGDRGPDWGPASVDDWHDLEMFLSDLTFEMITDAHDENVRFIDNTPVLMDMGC